MTTSLFISPLLYVSILFFYFWENEVVWIKKMYNQMLIYFILKSKRQFISENVYWLFDFFLFFSLFLFPLVPVFFFSIYFRIIFDSKISHASDKMTQIIWLRLKKQKNDSKTNIKWDDINQIQHFHMFRACNLPF